MIQIPVVKVVLKMDSETFSRDTYYDFQELQSGIAMDVKTDSVEIAVPDNCLALDKVLNFVNNVYTHSESTVSEVHITRVKFKEVV